MAPRWIQSWLPPVLLDLYRRRRAPKRYFGVFQRFEDISFESPWDTDRYLASAEACLAALEAKPFPPDPLPTCLTIQLVDLLSEAGPCRVLDFAGGAGITYFRIRPHLTRPTRVQWHVVDNKRLAELGERRKQAGDQIEFLAELPPIGTVYDLVHVNTALQYLSDYRPVLDRLTRYGAPHILLTEILLMTDQTTLITTQLVEGSRVPCTFIGFQELKEFLAERGYHLASRCPVGYGDYLPWYDESVPAHSREPHSWHLLFRRTETRPG